MQTDPQHTAKYLNIIIATFLGQGVSSEMMGRIYCLSESSYCEVVMFRAWIFRASGELGLLCIGPRAGRAFLYRVSSFFRAFPKYKMYPHFCLMSMKYEVLLLNFLKLSIGYKFGPI